MIGVELDKSGLVSLLVTRNSIARSLNSYKLPKMIDNYEACKKCYEKVECSLFQAAFSNKEDTNKTDCEILADQLTSHLPPSHISFFRKWEKGLTLEVAQENKINKYDSFSFKFVEESVKPDSSQTLFLDSSKIDKLINSPHKNLSNSPNKANTSTGTTATKNLSNNLNSKQSNSSVSNIPNKRNLNFEPTSPNKKPHYLSTNIVYSPSKIKLKRQNSTPFNSQKSQSSQQNNTLDFNKQSDKSLVLERSNSSICLTNQLYDFASSKKHLYSFKSEKQSDIFELFCEGDSVALSVGSCFGISSGILFFVLILFYLIFYFTYFYFIFCFTLF